MNNLSQQFSKRYAQMSDEQLVYEYGLIAQLTEEASAALSAEINKRRLDTSNVVIAQASTAYVGGETVALKKAMSISRKIAYWNALAVIAFLAIFLVAQLLGFEF